jgi:crotonobetainyl-CoA:carnitine CoA-transferase CaiB-like acyl-CoA transferase
MLQSTERTSPESVTGVVGVAADPNESTMQPLTGLRVLDLTAFLAGPAATQRLGDWGADVVKVEPPEHGEWSRSHPIVNAWLGGETTSFLSFNRNKRSIALDLRSAEGRDLLLQLSDVADVVVHNFRAGVVERLGIGADTLRSRNPRLVYAFISGYGTEGPQAQRPGQDLLLQAYSGVMFSVGAKEDRPQPGSVFAADVISSHFLAEGILAALLARDKTGAGQIVEVSMLAAMLDSQMQELVTFLNLDIAPERTEAPAAHALINPPYGVYETADGWIAIAMAEPTALAAALDSCAIHELDTWQKMADNRDVVFKEVASVVRTQTTQTWIERFDLAGVWSGPVHSYRDLARAPQIVANHYIKEMPLRDGTTFKAPDGAVRFSATATSYGPPPALDADRDAVLQEWLR